jgi:hypothetical protein
MLSKFPALASSLDGCEKMMKQFASTSQRKTASLSDSEYDTALTCHLPLFFQLPAKAATPAGGVLRGACEWQLRDAYICNPFLPLFEGNLSYFFFLDFGFNIIF